MALIYKQKDKVYTTELSLDNKEEKTMSISVSLDQKAADKVGKLFSNVQLNNKGDINNLYKKADTEIAKIFFGGKVAIIKKFFGDTRYDFDNIVFMVLLDFLAVIGKHKNDIADQVNTRHK